MTTNVILSSHHHPGAEMEINISHRTRQEILGTPDLGHPDLFNCAVAEVMQLMKTVSTRIQSSERCGATDADKLLTRRIWRESSGPPCNLWSSKRRIRSSWIIWSLQVGIALKEWAVFNVLMIPLTKNISRTVLLETSIMCKVLNKLYDIREWMYLCLLVQNYVDNNNNHNTLEYRPFCNRTSIFSYFDLFELYL